MLNNELGTEKGGRCQGASSAAHFSLKGMADDLSGPAGHVCEGQGGCFAIIILTPSPPAAEKVRRQARIESETMCRNLRAMRTPSGLCWRCWICNMSNSAFYRLVYLAARPVLIIAVLFVVLSWLAGYLHPTLFFDYYEWTNLVGDPRTRMVFCIGLVLTSELYTSFATESPSSEFRFLVRLLISAARALIVGWLLCALLVLLLEVCGIWKTLMTHPARFEGGFIVRHGLVPARWRCFALFVVGYLASIPTFALFGRHLRPLAYGLRMYVLGLLSCFGFFGIYVLSAALKGVTDWQYSGYAVLGVCIYIGVGTNLAFMLGALAKARRQTLKAWAEKVSE